MSKSKSNDSNYNSLIVEKLCAWHGHRIWLKIVYEKKYIISSSFILLYFIKMYLLIDLLEKHWNFVKNLKWQFESSWAVEINSIVVCLEMSGLKILLFYGWTICLLKLVNDRCVFFLMTTVDVITFFTYLCWWHWQQSVFIWF